MKKRLIWALVPTAVALLIVVLRFWFQYKDYIDVAGSYILGLDTYNEAKTHGGLIADYGVSYANDSMSNHKMDKCYLHRGNLRKRMSCVYSNGYFISIENLEKSPVHFVVSKSDTLKRRADKMGGFALRSIDRVPKSIVAMDKDGDVFVSYTLDSIYTKNIEAPLERKYWRQLVYIWNY